MKKRLLLLPLFLATGIVTIAQTINSVADGNYSSASTWDCNCVPGMGADVFVYNDVTLDQDLISVSSITVANGASLLEDAMPRTITLSGAILDVFQGTLNVYNLIVDAGSTMTTSGDVTCYNLVNNGAATVAVNGTMEAENIRNVGTLTNSNAIIASNILNKEILINNVQTSIIADYIYNGDSTGGTYAYMENSGSVHIFQDLFNEDSLVIYAAGQFCVGMNSRNDGEVYGNGDFCDSTGNDFDLDNGNISSTITYCVGLSSCWIISDIEESDESVSLYPNPVANVLYLDVEEGVVIENRDWVLYNAVGEEVMSQPYTIRQIEVSELPKGVYFLRQKGKQVSTKFVKQ